MENKNKIKKILSNSNLKVDNNYKIIDKIDNDNDNDLCKQIETSDTTLKKIINKHYKNRILALQLLNNLNEFYYPNLDFINWYYKLLYVDDKCLCNIQPKSKPIQLKMEFGRGKIGIANEISIKSKSYILKSIENVEFKENGYLTLRIYLLDSYHTPNNILKYNPSIEYNIRHTTKNEKAILTVEGDNYSNQTCIHFILNEIFNDMIPNYVYQYDAFYCLNKKKSGMMKNKYDGYNIMEIANKNDLSDYIDKQKDNFNNIDLIDIVKQILTPLSILKCKKFGFVHADLKCRNIFVHQDENGKIIYKIADFDKSSIFWKGIRFYTTQGKQDLSHYLINLTLKEITKSFIGFKVDSYNGINYYTLKSKIPIQIYSMHTWISIYGTYDIYTFLYSLMREPIVWEYYVMGNKNKSMKEFKKIWEKLWFEDDFNKIMIHLENLHEEHKTKNGDDQRQSLASLRSIGSMNNDLNKLQLKLKLDLDEIYKMVDLLSPSDINEFIDSDIEYDKIYNNLISKKITITRTKGQEYHLCTKPCIETETGILKRKSSSCKTNRYSSKGFSYDYDNNC
jgi:hypothetical protein